MTLFHQFGFVLFGGMIILVAVVFLFAGLTQAVSGRTIDNGIRFLIAASSVYVIAVLGTLLVQISESGHTSFDLSQKAAITLYKQGASLSSDEGSPDHE